MRKQPLTEALLRANLNLVLLPAATKLGQGNIFTRCVCPQGGVWSRRGGSPIFWRGLQFSGGSPIFWGVSNFLWGFSNFSGVSNFLEGSPIFGGLQFFFLFFSIFSPKKFFWGAPTPPPGWSMRGWYTSYWNVFLLTTCHSQINLVVLSYAK